MTVTTLTSPDVLRHVEDRWLDEDKVLDLFAEEWTAYFRSDGNAPQAWTCDLDCWGPLSPPSPLSYLDLNGVHCTII